MSLDSIVHADWDGKSPEAIVEDFPTLTAEQAYGAIAFYVISAEQFEAVRALLAEGEFSPREL